MERMDKGNKEGRHSSSLDSSDTHIALIQYEMLVSSPRC